MTHCTECPTCGQGLPGNLISIDLNVNAIIAGGVAVILTPREAEVADLLWRARPRVLTVEYIADAVFKDGADGMSSVPSWVHRLRRKIVAHGLPIWIKAEVGRGYRWVDVIMSEPVAAEDPITVGAH